MIEQLFDFFTWIFRTQAEIFAAAIVGAIGGGLAVVWALPLLSKWHLLRSKLIHPPELAALEHKIANLEQVNEHLQTALAALEHKSANLEQANEHLQTELAALEHKSADLRQANEHLQTELAALEHKSADLKQANEHLQTELSALEHKSADLKQANEHLQIKLSVLKQENSDLKQELESFNRQIQDIANTDGRVWERPLGNSIPEFVPRLNRRAVIIAVTNLKGGVGKTTLSANIGTTLANLGQEVLLVDLDHQHSLGDLCLTSQQKKDLEYAGHYVNNLFQPQEDAKITLRHCIKRVGERSLQCVSSNERLADVETQTMAAWLMGYTRLDVRYFLREALHDPVISGQFDWIILDCPPRLTTTSINALAASDFVLIPTILDATSSNAVPRMIKWLYRLKNTVGACPNVSLLGVIANGTQQRSQMTSREGHNWNTLQTDTKPCWDQSIYYFNRFLPNTAAFNHAADTPGQFACETPNLNAIFRDLVAELNTRVPRQ